MCCFFVIACLFRQAKAAKRRSEETRRADATRVAARLEDITRQLADGSRVEFLTMLPPEKFAQAMGDADLEPNGDDGCPRRKTETSRHDHTNDTNNRAEQENVK